MSAKENQIEEAMGFTEMFTKFAKILAVMFAVWLAGWTGLSFAWILLASGIIVVYMKQNKDRKRSCLIARNFANEPKSITDALQDLPAWVAFPDVERAEWINKILLQFWPYFGKVVKKTLQETVEPVIRSKVPSSLSGIRFETIRLGDIPPRIGGIKVHIDKVKRSEIVLDVDILYAGDSKITIAAKGLKVGVEDIQVRGNVRVILYPLLPEVPLLGGITMYFINRPQVDFDLTNILNVLETPGLNTLLRNLIDDVIASFIVLPNKVAISLSEQVKQGELKNRLPDGVLRIKIIEGRDLEAKDFKILGNGGTSDPYTNIVVGAEKFSTSVKSCTLNPIWNETFEMLVEESNRRTIDLTVFDRDRLPSKDESLGKKTLTLSKLLESGYLDFWFPLEKAKTGKMHVKLTWLTLNDNPDIVKSAEGTTPSKKSTLAKAVLIVHIDSASNLPRVRNSHSACNPVCKVIVGHTTQKTNKLTETVNPVWEQSLRFLVQDPEYQEVKFQVWDHKKDRLLGSLCVKIRKLLDAEKMTLQQAFPLDDCSQDSRLTAKLTLLGLTEPPKANNDESHNENTPEGDERADPIGGENATTTFTESGEDIANTTSEDVFNESQDVSFSSLNRSSSGKSDGDGKSKLGLFLRRARVFSSSSALDDDLKLTNPQGEINIALVYREKTKKLVIGIFQARDLINSNEDEDRSHINAYVRLYLLPDRSRSTRLTTDVVKHTSNPVFSETLWYMVDSLEECKRKKLDLMVKSETPLIKKAKGVRYGRTIIDLADEDLSSDEPKWRALYRVDEN